MPTENELLRMAEACEWAALEDPPMPKMATDLRSAAATLREMASGDLLASAIEQARAEEREACAKAADDVEKEREKLEHDADAQAMTRCLVCDREMLTDYAAQFFDRSVCLRSETSDCIKVAPDVWRARALEAEAKCEGEYKRGVEDAMRVCLEFGDEHKSRAAVPPFSGYHSGIVDAANELFELISALATTRKEKG